MIDRSTAIRSDFDSRAAGLLSAAILVAAIAMLIWVLAAYELGVLKALILVVAVAVVAATLRSPLAGVCLAVLAAPVEYLKAGPTGAGFSLTPAEAILILTAISATPRLLTTLSASRVPAALYAFGGLIVISFTGLFFAIDTFTVMKICLDWLAFGLIALFVSQRTPRELTPIAVSLAVAGGILGMMSLANLTNQHAVSGGAIVTNRAEASFAHPTALAFFLILTFPTAFALALRGSARLRWAMMTCGALGLIGLMLTETRGSIIGAAVALAWMMWRWRPFRRLAMAGLGLLAVIVVLNVGAITNAQPVTVFSERLGALSLSSRGDQRLKIWATTPSIIAAHPLLGIGQGNFRVVSPTFGLRDVGGAPFDHAHDLFLNVAAELGIAGLALLLLFLGSLARSARAALASRDSQLFPLAVSVSASLLAMLVNSLTEYPLRENLIMATIMIDVGLLLAIARASSLKPAS